MQMAVSVYLHDLLSFQLVLSSALGTVLPRFFGELLHHGACTSQATSKTEQPYGV